MHSLATYRIHCRLSTSSWFRSVSMVMGKIYLAILTQLLKLASTGTECHGVIAAMAKFWEHFRHGEFRRYYARPFSAAASFVTVSWFITIIVPWLIAYSCHQFWIKTMWYSEQPKATFQNQLLVLLETQTPGQVITWSTATNYNLMVGNSYIVRPPILTSYEVDVNMDGLTDFLNFTMEMPLFANEQIFGVQLLLVFKHTTYVSWGKTFFSDDNKVSIALFTPFRAEKLLFGGKHCSLHSLRRIPTWCFVVDCRWNGFASTRCLALLWLGFKYAVRLSQ